MRRCRLVVLGLLAGLAALVLPAAGRAADPPRTGFQPEVAVAGPTRLDWQFAAAGFGAKATRLPLSYESGKQRYQLFVPATYDATHPWPLVVFISPGDDPLGWRFWQKPCEDSGALFCAAYGAGNNCPPGQRIRLVLDMLDDVRRHYRVDPDQTYLAGFSGGGRMACTIAFALPEYFGGVVPICGTNPLHDLAYLRHRVRDRLSVAFVTGADDFNRPENEDYMHPFFQALGVRSRLWVVPKLGHGVPGPEVLGEVYGWLAEDLKRRRDDAKAYPGLAVAPDEVPTPLRQASRQVAAAQGDLQQPERTWEAVALLQGVVKRWGKTEAGERAQKLLNDILADAKQAARVAEQGGLEERRLLSAQAEALEQWGDLSRARQAWQLVLKDHPNSPEGRKAAAALRRLQRTPYLGVVFGPSLKVDQVDPKGPAGAAGLQAGDVVLQLEGIKVASLPELRRVLQAHEAGDKVSVEVKRGDKTVTLAVELGALPAAGQGP
jgi:dienelactone hydrolase